MSDAAPRDVPGVVASGDGTCRATVWAPAAEKVEVIIDGRAALLEPGARGYHTAVLEAVETGARYRLLLDGDADHADPASRWQPEGVHGPSAIADPVFPWTDDGWEGIPLEGYVTYEIHVGTFTHAGTFEAVIEHLDDLADLGVTALEVMPVAQFPGARNWGYDGVFPYAVQDAYGGPDGLKRLVDACHRRGLAFVLDVVYNHLGPEGAPHAAFGPYFSDRYSTPWGPALNVDGPGADEVRWYFIANALRWFEEFHVDALRLDAIHGIVDTSAIPFLQELAAETRRLGARLGRPLFLVAESDLNDPRVVMAPEHGGLGLDAMWSDDFHHALHALLTGERGGYYGDYGTVADLADAYNEGFVYAGRYSTYRGRTHGAPARGIPAERFVVCAQNHDQVGNRMHGERLSALVDDASLRLAAGAVLLGPALPLLFMGEEYGERAPFLYFVSHGDPELIEAVRSGRREEFAAFAWSGEAPDPYAEETFWRSKLDRTLRDRPEHAALRAYHRELLRLRRDVPALATPSRADMLATAGEAHLALRRRAGEQEVLVLMNFDEGPAVLATDPGARWTPLIDSADARYGGPGATVTGELAGGAEVTVGARALVALVRGAA